MWQTRVERNSIQIWAGEPRGWSRRQSPRRPLVRAARPSSSRPSCRSTMLQTTGRAGLLPVHVTGKRARSASRTSQVPHALDCEMREGTLRFVRRTVEVVVASSSHGIDQAPARLNEPASESPDASSGTPCCMHCGSAVFLGYTSGLPSMPSRPCCGPFTSPRLCRCSDRRHAHMAIRVPSCGRSDRRR